MRTVALLLLASCACLVRGQSQVPTLEGRIAMSQWYCDAARGHENSIFCKTEVLKNAISNAITNEDRAKARAALRAAEDAKQAEGMSAHMRDPERARMKMTWCKAHPEMTSDWRCTEMKARMDAVMQRVQAEAYWCLEKPRRAKADSVLCSYWAHRKRLDKVIDAHRIALNRARPDMHAHIDRCVPSHGMCPAVAPRFCSCAAQAATQKERKQEKARFAKTNPDDEHERRQAESLEMVTSLCKHGRTALFAKACASVDSGTYAQQPTRTAANLIAI